MSGIEPWGSRRGCIVIRCPSDDSGGGDDLGCKRLAAPPPAEPKKPGRRRAPAPQARRSAAPIELEIDGVVVRIGPGADAATVAAVIAALRATS